MGVAIVMNIYVTRLLWAPLNPYGHTQWTTEIGNDIKTRTDIIFGYLLKLCKAKLKAVIKFVSFDLHT